MKLRNSPVFKTLDPPERFLSTSGRIFPKGEVLHRIKRLIQNGQASPHDVDENGRTVFDIRRSSSTPKDSANSFAGVFWTEDEYLVMNLNPPVGNRGIFS